uniref:Uncharacterized protein n=1 Tax=Rhizophora mucronata TaxID=61149 RepID=A0A2P2P4T2_RHIMU
MMKPHQFPFFLSLSLPFKNVDFFSTRQTQKI